MCCLCLPSAHYCSTVVIAGAHRTLLILMEKQAAQFEALSFSLSALKRRKKKKNNLVVYIVA